MNNFFVRFSNECDREEIMGTILARDGKVVYSSPVLPIIEATMDEDIIYTLKESFLIDYITEKPIGSIAEFSGELTGIRNRLRIIPGLDLQKLRNSNFTGWGTTVAVLDSGVSASWVSEHHDYTGYGSNPSIDHGTKVASLIKEASPGSKIVSHKVCHGPEVNLTCVLQALDEAVKHADIINLSLGFDIKECKKETPCALCESVNFYAQNMKILFVTAAGNKWGEDSIQCPGKAQETITVSSVKAYTEEVADYASKGIPGIMKPNILTSGSIYFNNNHDEGTSFSAPIISGVSAAIYDVLNRDITNIKSILYTTAKDLGLPKHYQGFGLLDLDKLLEVVINDQGNSQSEGQI
ncbi:S8 family peptidase [Bacillus sp. IT-13CA1]|uniref:S8 family peptidase n=1 Tax=Bacillus sp. IT-13CA1 TaxID=3035929 RepID=UPI0039E0B373